MKLALILLAVVLQGWMILDMVKNTRRLCRARRAHAAERRARRDEL